MEQMMKKVFISILAAVAVFSGCNTVLIEETGMGQFALDLSAEDEYTTVTKTSEASETKTANEDVNKFKIKIVRPSDGFTKEYEKFGDMPQILQLPSGSYTLIANSPNTLPAAFNQPIYGTSHNFIVKVGEVTSESLVCTLQNVKVTFDLKDEFKSELKDYTITVSNGEGAVNNLYWTNVESEVEDQYTTKDMTKAGYFTLSDEAKLTIHVNAKRKVDNSEAYHEIQLTSAAARDHFKVTLGAKVTGQSGFQITIDPSVNERPEDAFVPGFDEDAVEGEWDTPVGGGDNGSGDNGSGDNGSGDNGSGDNGDSGDEPVTNPITLNWPQNPTLAKTDIADDMQVVMYVKAPAGIKKFIVTVRSESQTFLSTCSLMTSNPMSEGNISSVVIDLIDDPAAVISMAGIGLKTGNDIKGKTDDVEFNISTLVPLIPSQGPVYGSDYIFNLAVTDNNDVSNDWNLVFHLPSN